MVSAPPPSYTQSSPGQHICQTRPSPRTEGKHLEGWAASIRKIHTHAGTFADVTAHGTFADVTARYSGGLNVPGRAVLVWLVWLVMPR